MGHRFMKGPSVHNERLVKYRLFGRGGEVCRNGIETATDAGAQHGYGSDAHAGDQGGDQPVFQRCHSPSVGPQGEQ